MMAAMVSMLASCGGNANKAAEAEDDANTIVLFDGSSLEGWRGYGKDHVPARWSIEDGCLKFSGSGGGEAQTGEGGDIIYAAQKFKNFELELEWKISKGGNSGIFYLAQETAGPIYISAPECQVLDNENHREDLGKLKELATGYRSVASFLDDLLLDNTKIDEHDSEGKVVISTIHSVKGLEFNTVIVLDCVDGVFPNVDDIGSKEDNEELRCFYVAVTRAKERLYIMCPRVAMRYGRSIMGNPSHYLEDAYDLVNWTEIGSYF